MNTITLIIVVASFSGSLANTNINSMTQTYPDIKSCVAALQQVLEENASKPNVASVSATCTVVNTANALKAIMGGK